MRKSTAAVIVAALAIVAYVVNPIVPDGIEEKLKFRLLLGSNKLIQNYANLQAFFTSSPEDAIVEWTKGLRASAAFVTSFASTSSFGPGVTRSITEFDGTTVYVYTPPKRTKELNPGFVFIHGGGLTFGSAESYDCITRRISLSLNAIVISIDYRLAPEYPFPVPFEDSLRATKWFLKNAKSYRVDPERVAIGGDSAGGYLTAAVAQAIYDDPSVPNLKLQILIYPWTQSLDTNYPSYQKYEKEFKGNGIVSRKAMSYFIAMHVWGKNGVLRIQDIIENKHTSSRFKKSAVYKERFSHDLLPDEFKDPAYYEGKTPDNVGDESIWNEKKDVFLDERFSPHLRKNFSGLPPAYVLTAGFDPLRDEGIIYSKLLEKDGVNVTWVHYEQAFHAIFHMTPITQFRLGTKMLDDMLIYTSERL